MDDDDDDISLLCWMTRSVSNVRVECVRVELKAHADDAMRRLS